VTNLFWKFVRASLEEVAMVTLLMVLGLLVAVLVRAFWNMSIPGIFGGREITWPQAWGLYMLFVVALRLLPWKSS